MGSLPSLNLAYAYCERVAKTHYENFTVASFLLPKGLRPYFNAVYAFCRHTDDLGDEAEGDRFALLHEWESDLSRVYGGSPKHPIMFALQDVAQRFGIPEEPFRRLITANRMDQSKVRFQTYSDLIQYCEHSATPVGQMVLYIIGDTTEESREFSDATCTALQMTNFWQDVRRDYEMDRIYLPLEDMEAFQYTEQQLAGNVCNTAFRNLLCYEITRAKQLFKEGAPLIDRLNGRVKLDIALFSKGGMRVLDMIAKQNYDVLSKRPTVSATRKLWLAATTSIRLAFHRRP